MTPLKAFDHSYLSAGNTAGQVYPTVTVSTLGDCQGFTITENYTWLSYTRSGLNLTFTVTANPGPARTAYVWLGTSDSPITITQAS
jgi:hypothetical protein